MKITQGIKVSDQSNIVKLKNSEACLGMAGTSRFLRLIPSKQSSIFDGYSALFVILVVSLALRLILVIYVAPYPERYVQADAVGYDRLAMNLVSGNGFSMASAAPFSPDNFRTPIYPLTLASCYALFGHHPSVVLFLQAFMGALTVLIVYYMANLISGPKAGLCAAALLSINPHPITYTALLWSDTEYTLVLALSILLTIIMLSRPDLKWVLWSSLSIGIATLTHPRSLYLPFFFTFILLASRIRNKLPVRQALLHAGLYLCMFNLVLLPWRARNYVVFGVPNLTSAQGFNMLYYGAALTEATQTGEDQWHIAEQYTVQVLKMSDTPLNEAKFADIALQLALEKVARSPWSYAKVHLIGTAKVFLPGTFLINTLLTGQTEVDMGKVYSAFIVNPFSKNAFFEALSTLPMAVWSYIGFDILCLLIIYLLSFYATIVNYRSLSWTWFLVVLIIYLAVVAGPAGTPRFRVAIMPMLCVLATCSLPDSHTDWRHKSAAEMNSGPSGWPWYGKNGSTNSQG